MRPASCQDERALTRVFKLSSTLCGLETLSMEAKLMDAATIDWQSIDDHRRRASKIGEFVSAEAGGMPIYQVMSLVGGTAWLRDVETAATA